MSCKSCQGVVNSDSYKDAQPWCFVAAFPPLNTIHPLNRNQVHTEKFSLLTYFPKFYCTGDQPFSVADFG
jgi:hypothetical protein